MEPFAFSLLYEKKKEDIPRKIVPANAKQNGNRKKRTGEQMRLPELFLERMKELTGEEYGLWLDAYDKPPTQGIRINPEKITPEIWEKICPWEIHRVLWNKNGYYCQPGSHPAKDAYYYAGLYYVQEPSAMAPAAVLSVQPGERVLDLCAAPGGKSTQLGADLLGRGFLVANDISPSRGKALLKNLEMAGLSNICVTAEPPQKLAQVFDGYFDKILVDGPCSGEGMFRKEPELIKSWMNQGPEHYVPLQREILISAVKMLKPGGRLVYSTCTFSREENEENVEWLLDQEPDLEMVPIPAFSGVKRGVNGQSVLRLYPHMVFGEGHFVALLEKKKTSPTDGLTVRETPKKKWELSEKSEVLSLEKDSDFKDWERLYSRPLERGRIMVRQGQIYLLPEELNPAWKLRFLRTGLLLGTVKKNRFEPSQAMAMALKKEDFAQCLCLDREDERVIRYLKGESIFLKEGESFFKGWVLVCVDGFPLGWAKAGGSGLKNKYYPGWRWQ